MPSFAWRILRKKKNRANLVLTYFIVPLWGFTISIMFNLIRDKMLTEGRDSLALLCSMKIVFWVKSSRESQRQEPSTPNPNQKLQNPHLPIKEQNKIETYTFLENHVKKDIGFAGTLSFSPNIINQVHEQPLALSTINTVHNMWSLKHQPKPDVLW